MILKLLFLTVLLVGCVATTDSESFEHKYLTALNNCVDRLSHYDSFLIDKKSGALIEAYKKVRVTETEGSLISHVQFGVNNPTPKAVVSETVISDKRSGVCWFDSSYKVVALKAPHSSETISLTKYDAMSDSLVEKELRNLKEVINSQKTRKVFETIYVYDAGVWVLEGREERVEKIDSNLVNYVNDQLRAYD